MPPTELRLQLVGAHSWTPDHGVCAGRGQQDPYQGSREPVPWSPPPFSTELTAEILWHFTSHSTRVDWMTTGYASCTFEKIHKGSSTTLCPLYFSEVVLTVSQTFEAITHSILWDPDASNSRAGKHSMHYKVLICKFENWKYFQASSHFLSETHWNSQGSS